MRQGSTQLPISERLMTHRKAARSAADLLDREDDEPPMNIPSGFDQGSSNGTVSRQGRDPIAEFRWSQSTWAHAGDAA